MTERKTLIHGWVITVCAVLGMVLTAGARASVVTPEGPPKRAGAYGLGVPEAPLADPTVWMPTDDDVNVLSFWRNPRVSFGLFDDDNMTLDPARGFLEIDPKGDLLEFSSVGADWNVENRAGDTFTLTGGERFLLAAIGPGTGGWTGDIGVRELAPNAHQLKFPRSARSTPLTGVDISPAPAVVPLPAAAWLFGSGLIGLVGVVRRRPRG